MLASAVIWIPSGKAKSVPDMYEGDAPEAEGDADANMRDEAVPERNNTSDSNNMDEEDDIVKQYGLDDYDNEECTRNPPAVASPTLPSNQIQ
jgi:hypothetical protein